MDARGRIGIHWFAEAQTIERESLDRFLPHLRRLGIGWLVLRDGLAPRAAAAPVAARLRDAGIEPLLRLRIGDADSPERVGAAASPWVLGGVRYIALDERPNGAGRWSRWQPHGLARRYARWIAPRLATVAALGATPILPPLAPGGDYWHTRFLEEVLDALRETDGDWLDRLALGFINDLAGRPVSWGRGGPARWGTPLRSPARGQEDAIGFHMWEWYRAIGERVLERPVELFALETRLGRPAERAAQISQILATLEREGAPELAASLWLLAAPARSPERAHALFGADGTPLQPALIEALARPTPPQRPQAPRTLPGVVRLLLPEGGVETMPLERYLRGVLPRVIRPGAPDEALRAQAIAARSYAIHAIEGPRHPDQGADLCATAHCQPWARSRHPRTDNAVRESAGTVVLFDAEVANTLYFARCDGRTRDSESVWRAPLAYCRAVTCVHRGGELEGHGVGLCQHGAVIMARQGASAEDILRHYYSRSEVRRIGASIFPAARASRATAANVKIERQPGRRAIAGTFSEAGVPVTVADPWGNRYLAVSGSRPDLGCNGWAVPLPVDTTYRVAWSGREIEVAVSGDVVLLHVA